jgi:hypothetical protein
MRVPRPLALAVPFALAFAGSSSARGGDAPPTGGLASLAWLEGVWEGKTDEGDVETAYTSPTQGSMLSSMKMNRAGKEVHFDFERWREEAGTVVMTPFPRGRASLDFRATEVDAKGRRVVLVNAENDFPSKFVYASPAKDKLSITLEGTQGGRPARMSFELTRRKTL